MTLHLLRACSSCCNSGDGYGASIGCQHRVWLGDLSVCNSLEAVDICCNTNKNYAVDSGCDKRQNVRETSLLEAAYLAELLEDLLLQLLAFAHSLNHKVSLTELLQGDVVDLRRH